MVAGIKDRQPLYTVTDFDLEIGAGVEITATTNDKLLSVRAACAPDQNFDALNAGRGIFTCFLNDFNFCHVIFLENLS